MKYSSNDFYLKFNIICNEEGNLIDYIFDFVSGEFQEITHIDPTTVLGKKFSDIAIDYGDRLNLKEIYSSVISNVKLKFDIFIDDLQRFYLVSMFYDNSCREKQMILYFSDITQVKGNKFKLMESAKLKDNIIYFKDRERVSMYYRDKLTGLYNKIFFEEEICRLDTIRQLPMSIIMGDINGLKLINDAFGHSMGDALLKKAGEIMLQSFREEDIVSRVGGDEFIVMLPRTSEETALEIADRVKANCEHSYLEFLKINLSFGVASKTNPDENIDKIIKKAEDRMYFKKIKESKEARLSMVNFLKVRLEKITFETKADYERLKSLTMMMANSLGLSDNEKEKLCMLCEFHDIGKIGVPKSILQKEGHLNNEELENLKRHSEIGYYIAKELGETKIIDELILVHHEHWDGTGYPGLFKGNEIPIIARIFAIADAYDAMVSNRLYRKKMTKQEALNEIKSHAGKQFDPHISELFIDLMETEESIVN